MAGVLWLLWALGAAVWVGMCLAWFGEGEDIDWRRALFVVVGWPLVTLWVLCRKTRWD